jgi:hypothetical protein
VIHTEGPWSLMPRREERLFLSHNKREIVCFKNSMQENNDVVYLRIRKVKSVKISESG